MIRGLSGSHQVVSTIGERCSAFVPYPLPPDPPIAFSPELIEQLAEASAALGRLDGISLLLPNPSTFIYSYLRKEAVLSSQIEGTQSTLTDLLLFENQGAPGAPLDDVHEVSNYVAALEEGIEMIRKGWPLSVRLIRNVHQTLLSHGRGAEKTPGEFRTSLNWIGGSRPGNAIFVPPPPEQIGDCIGSLEKFLNDVPVKTPLLLKAGLAHVQFETIHPFLDGNGRVGRLLVTLILCSGGAMQQPLLYLSLYLKQHREVYYDLLQKVRTHGDWESWLLFFWRAVSSTANQAYRTAKNLRELFDEDRAKLRKLKRASASALEVFLHFQSRPVGSISQIKRVVPLSFATLNAATKHLVRLKILRELSGRSRNRIYAYDRYLEILNADDKAP